MENEMLIGMVQLDTNMKVRYSNFDYLGGTNVDDIIEKKLTL